MFVNFLFIFLCLFTGCVVPESSKQETAKDHFGKDRDRVIYRALKKFIKGMEAKGYRAAGIGEGIDHSTRRQNYLGVTFDTEHLPNVEFARKVEVNALQEFQKYINEEEGIQDYVAEYPYPIKFIEITFINKQSPQGLFSVANCENELIYRQDDPCQTIGPSIIIHRETYEEAVRILEQQTN